MLQAPEDLLKVPQTYFGNHFNSVIIAVIYNYSPFASCFVCHPNPSEMSSAQVTKATASVKLGLWREWEIHVAEFISDPQRETSHNSPKPHLLINILSCFFNPDCPRGGHKALWGIQDEHLSLLRRLWKFMKQHTSNPSNELLWNALTDCLQWNCSGFVRPSQRSGCLNCFTSPQGGAYPRLHMKAASHSVWWGVAQERVRALGYGEADNEDESQKMHGDLLFDDSVPADGEKNSKTILYMQKLAYYLLHSNCAQHP